MAREGKLEAKKLNRNSRSKRTSVGKNKNVKPKSKNKKRSFKKYRGQG